MSSLHPSFCWLVSVLVSPHFFLPSDGWRRGERGGDSDLALAPGADVGRRSWHGCQVPVTLVGVTNSSEQFYTNHMPCGVGNRHPSLANPKERVEVHRSYLKCGAWKVRGSPGSPEVSEGNSAKFSPSVPDSAFIPGPLYLG